MSSIRVRARVQIKVKRRFLASVFIGTGCIVVMLLDYNAEGCGFESACSLLLFLLQHLRLRYFNTFKSLLDFLMMTSIVLDDFTLAHKAAERV